MKAELDWLVLKGPVSAFIICLILSAALIGGTWYFEEDMLKKYNSDNDRFQAVSKQYLAVDQEEKLIRKFYPKFVELYDKGIIGQEHRLNWIETLRASGEYIKLPGLRYNISSQVAYTPDYPVNTGSFRIYSSTMKLNLDLLHEGDFRQLLTALNQHAQGTYNLSKCIFHKTNPVDLTNITRGNISAECDLNWFSIKKSDGSVINFSS